MQKANLWPTDRKHSICIPVSKKGDTNDFSSYSTIAPISYSSKGCSKLYNNDFSPDMEQEMPDIQGGFRKGRGTRNHTANIHGLPYCSARKTVPGGWMFL